MTLCRPAIMPTTMGHSLSRGESLSPVLAYSPVPPAQDINHTQPDTMIRTITRSGSGKVRTEVVRHRKRALCVGERPVVCPCHDDKVHRAHSAISIVAFYNAPSGDASPKRQHRHEDSRSRHQCSKCPPGGGRCRGSVRTATRRVLLSHARSSKQQQECTLKEFQHEEQRRKQLFHDSDDEICRKCAQVHGVGVECASVAAGGAHQKVLVVQTAFTAPALRVRDLSMYDQPLPRRRRTLMAMVKDRF